MASSKRLRVIAHLIEIAQSEAYKTMNGSHEKPRKAESRISGRPGDGTASTQSDAR